MTTTTSGAIVSGTYRCKQDGRIVEAHLDIHGTSVILTCEATDRRTVCAPIQFKRRYELIKEKPAK